MGAQVRTDNDYGLLAVGGASVALQEMTTWVVAAYAAGNRSHLATFAT